MARRKITELNHDRTNANKGTDRGRAALEASLRQYGAGRSILLDKHGNIIAGNKTAEVAKTIGMDDVVIVQTDGTQIIAVQRTDLDIDSPQGRGLAYADNRVGELSLNWNAEQVLADIGAGIDLSGLWDKKEMDDLLSAIRPPATQDTEPQIDRAEELRQKWGVEPGQLWQLGEHRLICGDCTDAAVVARVMGGERAQVVFTSPPYAQQRQYREGAKEKVKDWDALMCGCFGAALCADDCQVLVNLGLVHDDGEWLPYWDNWIEWMRSQGWRRFGWYVWDQGAGLPGDWSGRLAPSFEFVFHFNRTSIRPSKWVTSKMAGQIADKRTFRHDDGRLKPFTQNGVAYGDTKIPDSVIRVNRQIGDTGHPAPFSVDFPASVLNSWGGLVYEPFSGSGTTLIACENLGRRCRAVEIAPGYVAVALERFYQHSGKVPVLVSGE